MRSALRVRGGTVNAFDDGRVGLWINNSANLVARLGAISKFSGGMFSDVFLSRAASKDQFNIVRQTVRPDGTKLKAQLYEIASGTAQQFASLVDSDITRL